MVQWLRLRLPMQGVWVQSLVRELRSHMPQGQKTKTENRSNNVTNSIQTLKMVHIKKKILKKPPIPPLWLSFPQTLPTLLHLLQVKVSFP